MNSPLFHDDGCFRATIRTRDYRVTLEGKCGHTKIRRAEITVSAESAEDAMHYAATYLMIPQTVPVSATEVSRS
jgi:hypothetical protein